MLSNPYDENSTSYYLFAYENGGFCATNNTYYLNYSTWGYKSEVTHESMTLSDFSLNYNDYMSVNTSQTISINLGSTSAYTDIGFFRFYTKNQGVASFSNTQSTILNSNASGFVQVHVVHRPTGIVKYFILTVGDPIPSGQYYIVNKEAAQFIGLLNGSTTSGTPLFLNDWTNTKQNIWNIISTGNGQCYISSAYSGNYIGSNGGGNGSMVNQYNSISSDVYINIRATDLNAYKLCTSNGNSYNGALTYTTVGNTKYLFQKTYTQDEDYSDEWYLIPANMNTSFSTNVGITNNESYYIANSDTSRCITRGSSTSTVTTTELNSSENQRWSLDIVNSNQARYIYSEMDNITTVLQVSGTSVSIGMNHYMSSQCFTVYRINVWPYEGQYLIMNGDAYLTEDTSTHVLYLSSELLPSSFWCVYPYSSHHADIYAFKYGNFDTTGTFSHFSNTMNKINYVYTTNTNKGPDDLFNLLDNNGTQFLAFRGHAGPGSLCFYNSSGNSIGNFCAQAPEDIGTSTSNRYVSDLADNELNDLRIAVLLGCNSGLPDSNGNCLLDAMYEKGTQFVLGTYDTTTTSDNNTFFRYLLKAFYDYPSSMTMGDAIEYAYNRMKAPDNYSGIYLPSYGKRVLNSPILYKGNLKCMLIY